MSCPTRHQSASLSPLPQQTALSTLTHPWSRGVAASLAMKLARNISSARLAHRSVQTYPSFQQRLSAVDQASSVV